MKKKKIPNRIGERRKSEKRERERESGTSNSEEEGEKALRFQLLLSSAFYCNDTATANTAVHSVLCQTERNRKGKKDGKKGKR